MMNGTVGLGFTGSENLYRTQEGIKWVPNKKEGPFQGLREYPVHIKVTKAAAHLIIKESADYEHSQIQIFARTLSGRKVALLCVNCNFFGYLMNRFKGEDSIEDSVRTRFSPLRTEHESIQKIWPSTFFDERSYDAVDLRPDDVVCAFQADYSLGYSQIDEKREFVSKTAYWSEALQLEIDAEENQFKITLNQTALQLSNQKSEPSTDVEPITGNPIGLLEDCGRPATSL
jgi:hypothetical protein